MLALKTEWKTQLLILCVGQTILIAMMMMSLPYWPLYISKLGAFSPREVRFWSALIYTAPFVTSILSAPFWGKLSDRYGHKSMVIRACIGLLITQTFILFSTNVYWIFISRLLQGVLAGFVVAAQSLALNITPKEKRGATIGKLQASTAIGNLFGPLLGGLIATYAGYQAIFISSSLLCALITLLFFLFLKTTPSPLNQTTLPVIKPPSLNQPFQLQREISLILLVILVIQLARSMPTPVFSLFVIEKLGGNDISVGVLYAAMGLMVFLTAPYWGRLFDTLIEANYAIPPILTGLLFLCAGIQVLHAYAITSMQILLLRLAWGACLGALLPVLLRLLIDQVNPEKQGLFLGLGDSATKVGNLIGILIGALIEFNFGYTHCFLFTALLYVMGGVITILLPLPPAKIMTHGDLRS